MEDQLIPIITDPCTINSTLDTAEKTLSLVKNGLNFFEKHGFVGISQKRQQRLLDKQKFVLKQDAKNRAYTRMQAIEDAVVENKARLVKELGTITLEEIKKRFPELKASELTSYIQEIMGMVGTITKNAFDDQKARENIVMLALDNLEKNTDNKEIQDEPSDTWMAQFMEYAGKIRDEDIAELWGKILADEYKKPGSYSLSTLSILHSLDVKYANLFKTLFPYIIDNDFIPENAFELMHIGLKEKEILKSLGLIITGLVRNKNVIVANNKYYISFDPNYTKNENNTYSFSGVLLTPAGEEIANIFPPTKEECKNGMELFAEIVHTKYGKDLKITDIETVKAQGGYIGENPIFFVKL